MSRDRIDIGEGHESKPSLRPHGRTLGAVEGAILRLEVTGPTNVEHIRSYAQRVRPLLERMSLQGPFGILTEVRNSLMMPPDAIDGLAAVIAEDAELGIVRAGVAYVADQGVEGRDLMLPLIRDRIYLPLNIHFASFETIDIAEAWLRSVLGTVTRSTL
jgi:hypothetical protein